MATLPLLLFSLSARAGGAALAEVPANPFGKTEPDLRPTEPGLPPTERPPVAPAEPPPPPPVQPQYADLAHLEQEFAKAYADWGAAQQTELNETGQYIRDILPLGAPETSVSTHRCRIR